MSDLKQEEPSTRPKQDGGLNTSLTEKSKMVNNAAKPNQYIDDISLFMAWQNWCLMEHNRFLSNFCMFQLSQQQMAIQQQQQQSPVLNNQAFNGQTSGQFNVQNNEENRAVNVKIASLKRRLAAEILDFFFLIFVKLFVITYIFGERYANHFQYVLVIDENTSFEDLQVTLIQALLFRVVAIAYEGYCLSGTLPFSNGATLGKRVMKIEAIKCELAEDVDAMEGRVRVIPGGSLGVCRSVVRAILKNAIISLFFPMLLPFQMIASSNRLIYDVAVSTIVIEKE